MAGSIDRLTVGPRDPHGYCSFHRIAGVARRPYGVDLPFAQFIRGTKVPPRDAFLAPGSNAKAVQALFERIGCNVCHVQAITTAPPGTPINGGALAIPAARGKQNTPPLCGLLLPDIKS